ncbi:penicillin-insensitive murein endopeptidase [Mesorhizobium sp. RMAD-H1]|uniref:penicillin-insensitive murein endopeptidase n=1 Tax=Mesorhizobium sp. RMAD-H1 TaxID=2587065 RepID=UPI001621F07C|nr:penicillin-insensitive murein endopeptidase [Mesorhizobium sp. RMAD-H1]MBB2972221.1 penicillin-insensitive murein endopeptidase [Mesorhizobium sp. RMAD-H1]
MSAKRLTRIGLAALLCAATALEMMSASDALAEQPAKQAFGGQKLPAVAKPESVGFYSKGCLAGGVAIPVDGPNWQVMRLSRNRRWGHPRMIALLERLSREAAQDGWTGLLVGDISQPRGGPMLTGHASHQIGLDADIWLTPMPNRRLTAEERENTSAVSMLRKDSLYVDPDIWTPAHAALLKRAANYPEVERIFVHPGIKKKLCDTVTGDRGWMAKVRPYWGHHYHFHVRISCQPGSPGCKPQEPINRNDDGCGKSLAWWFTDEPWKPAKPVKPTKPPKPKKPMMLSDLPPACARILNEPAPASIADVTFGLGRNATAAATAPNGVQEAIPAAPAVPAAAFAAPTPPASIPLPVPRPRN